MSRVHDGVERRRGRSSAGAATAGAGDAQQVDVQTCDQAEVDGADVTRPGRERAADAGRTMPARLAGAGVRRRRRGGRRGTGHEPDNVDPRP
ncbi:hypothetical protein FRAHR75_10015 [Frankia sp. Hr75.2]|nr:hypothetical protein FRAHR75_10015 [Frankia sp. Hr75.2]SQD99365.1 hypothetical protein FMEAI12_5260005 [Parafrankia sp. Ea1.12]